MALIDKDARNVMIGVGVGVGIAALLPAVKPILGDVGRPLAKASIKTGILAYEKGRELSARWREVLEDLVAEVQAELSAQAGQPAVAPPASQTNGGA
jgi:Protein of unknown function (DUF5132)